MQFQVAGEMKNMKYRFAHQSISVGDINRSIKFYTEALGLKVEREFHDGPLTLVFLGDGIGRAQVELSNFNGNPAPEINQDAIHMAFIASDYYAGHEKHVAMGCKCGEHITPEGIMDVYFIQDPDGYRTEIVSESNTELHVL